MMPAGTPGGKSGSSVGVGTKSTVWSGSGAGVDCASLSASSRREQFSKSPNVSGRCVCVFVCRNREKYRLLGFYNVGIKDSCASSAVLT